MDWLFWIIVAVTRVDACATEDSQNCYWVASDRGHGPGANEGSSFITFGPEEKQVYIHFPE